MKKIILFVVVIALISCKKEDGISAVSNGAYIWFKNTNGANLLNTNDPNAVNSADIDTYLLQNGIKSQVYRPLMTLKEGFRIENTPQGNLMTLYFDTMPASMVMNKVTMFIRYKDGSEDKLVGEFNEDRSTAVYLKNVWVNDVLKWTYSPASEVAQIDIIK